MHLACTKLRRTMSKLPTLLPRKIVNDMMIIPKARHRTADDHDGVDNRTMTHGQDDIMKIMTTLLTRTMIFMTRKDVKT